MILYSKNTKKYMLACATLMFFLACSNGKNIMNMNPDNDGNEKNKNITNTNPNNDEDNDTHYTASSSNSISSISSDNGGKSHKNKNKKENEKNNKKEGNINDDEKDLEPNKESTDNDNVNPDFETEMLIDNKVEQNNIFDQKQDDELREVESKNLFGKHKPKPKPKPDNNLFVGDGQLGDNQPGNGQPNGSEQLDGNNNSNSGNEFSYNIEEPKDIKGPNEFPNKTIIPDLIKSSSSKVNTDNEIPDDEIQEVLTNKDDKNMMHDITEGIKYKINEYAEEFKNIRKENKRKNAEDKKIKKAQTLTLKKSRLSVEFDKLLLEGELRRRKKILEFYNMIKKGVRGRNWTGSNWTVSSLKASILEPLIVKNISILSGIEDNTYIVDKEGIVKLTKEGARKANKVRMTGNEINTDKKKENRKGTAYFVNQNNGVQAYSDYSNVQQVSDSDDNNINNINNININNNDNNDADDDNDGGNGSGSVNNSAVKDLRSELNDEDEKSMAANIRTKNDNNDYDFDYDLDKEISKLIGKIEHMERKITNKKEEIKIQEIIDELQVCEELNKCYTNYPTRFNETILLSFIDKKMKDLSSDIETGEGILIKCGEEKVKDSCNKWKALLKSAIARGPVCLGLLSLPAIVYSGCIPSNTAIRVASIVAAGIGLVFSYLTCTLLSKINNKYKGEGNLRIEGVFNSNKDKDLSYNRISSFDDFIMNSSRSEYKNYELSLSNKNRKSNYSSMFEDRV